MTGAVFKRAILALGIGAAIGSAFGAQAQPPRGPRPPPPAAPAPGSAGVYLKGDELSRVLEASTKANPLQGVSPVTITDRYSMNLVRRGGPGPAGSHPGWAELHYILEGGGVFVTGGHLVPKPGGGGSTIEGGVSKHVTKGDAVLIPAGSPHWYQAVDDHVTYLEVRFPDATVTPPPRP